MSEVNKFYLTSKMTLSGKTTILPKSNPKSLHSKPQPFQKNPNHNPKSMSESSTKKAPISIAKKYKASNSASKKQAIAVDL